MLFHKRYDFRRENVTEHKMCVLIFIQPSSELFILLRIIQWDTVINGHKSLMQSTRYSRQVCDET